MAKATVEKAVRVARIKIYKVEINDEVKMVRTTTRAKAIKHFIKNISAVIPTPDELVELVKTGVNVEEVEG